MIKKRNSKSKGSITVLFIVIILVILLGRSDYSEDLFKIFDRLYQPTSSTSQNQDGNNSILEGVIIRISDGDTVILEDSKGVKHKIRLDGIDAPEIGQKYGMESKIYLEDFALNKYATINIIGKDQFDRLLSVLFIDNINVNEALLSNGLAWQYRFNNNNTYKALVEKARRAKKNIWSDPNSIDPYVWRKQNNNKQN